MKGDSAYGIVHVRQMEVIDMLQPPRHSMARRVPRLCRTFHTSAKAAMHLTECLTALPAVGRGYNTAAEREAARNMPGVHVLSLEQMCLLLRWGVLTGVRRRPFARSQCPVPCTSNA